jgi:hypothetical protein
MSMGVKIFSNGINAHTTTTVGASLDNQITHQVQLLEQLQILTTIKLKNIGRIFILHPRTTNL